MEICDPFLPSERNDVTFNTIPFDRTILSASNGACPALEKTAAVSFILSAVAATSSISSIDFWSK